VPKRKPKRRSKSLARAYEVKAEISNATLAKAKSALTLQIYRKNLKLGELQIGRDRCSGLVRGGSRPNASIGADSRR